MIESIMQAVAAPFTSQVGVQGVAYGLLGLKTIRRVIEFAREQWGPSYGD